MKTPEEIALTFAEDFQNNYPIKKQLWKMMDDLRKEIQEYGDEREARFISHKRVKTRKDGMR